MRLDKIQGKDVLKTHSVTYASTGLFAQALNLILPIFLANVAAVNVNVTIPHVGKTLPTDDRGSQGKLAKSDKRSGNYGALFQGNLLTYRKRREQSRRQVKRKIKRHMRISG